MVSTRSRKTKTPSPAKKGSAKKSPAKSKKSRAKSPVAKKRSPAKAASSSSSSFGNPFGIFGGGAVKALVVGLAVVWLLKAIGDFDIMSGLTEHAGLGKLGLQFAISAFCMVPGSLSRFDGALADDHWDPTKDSASDRDFTKTGEVREDEYTKQSIYSLLYGLYRAVGKVKHTTGEMYQFTFNTWGIAHPGGKANPFGPEDPQRHGKASYYGLATFDAVNEYIAAHPKAHWLEIGCGTGAGANLITREVHPTIQYTAVDMQLAAIETCRKIHATPDNPNLNCKHSNGKSLDWVPSNSVDIVMITETHIAEMAIGDEEKIIFGNIIRMLKPGGLFVWGNALPTKVWHDAYAHLESVGFSDCGRFNHTASAITARDEDEARVNLYVDQAMDTFPVLRMPFNPGKKCRHVCDRLLKNFYRHPGTDLYQRMVVGHDSYMHLCYRIDKKAETIEDGKEAASAE